MCSTIFFRIQHYGTSILHRANIKILLTKYIAERAYRLAINYVYTQSVFTVYWCCIPIFTKCSVYCVFKYSVFVNAIIDSLVRVFSKKILHQNFRWSKRCFIVYPLITQNRLFHLLLQIACLRLSFLRCHRPIDCIQSANKNKATCKRI